MHTHVYLFRKYIWCFGRSIAYAVPVFAHECYYQRLLTIALTITIDLIENWLNWLFCKFVVDIYTFVFAHAYYCQWLFSSNIPTAQLQSQFETTGSSVIFFICTYPNFYNIVAWSIWNDMQTSQGHREFVIKTHVHVANHCIYFSLLLIKLCHLWHRLNTVIIHS